MKRTDEQKIIVGERIATVFNLKFDRKSGFYKTGYGNKSALGVFNMFETIAEKLLQGDEKRI